jgi:hypothetical protein
VRLRSPSPQLPLSARSGLRRDGDPLRARPGPDGLAGGREALRSARMPSGFTLRRSRARPCGLAAVRTTSASSACFASAGSPFAPASFPPRHSSLGSWLVPSTSTGDFHAQPHVPERDQRPSQGRDEDEGLCRHPRTVGGRVGALRGRAPTPSRRSGPPRDGGRTCVGWRRCRRPRFASTGSDSESRAGVAACRRQSPAWRRRA